MLLGDLEFEIVLSDGIQGDWCYHSARTTLFLLVGSVVLQEPFGGSVLSVMVMHLMAQELKMLKKQLLAGEKENSAQENGRRE